MNQFRCLLIAQLLLLEFSTSFGKSTDIKETNDFNQTTFLSTRIRGGIASNLGEFPYIVFVGTNTFQCGGVIINSLHILTAAHCAKAKVDQYKIIAGERILNAKEGTEQSRRVIQIIAHPLRNTVNYANDLAIMKLDQQLIFNEYVKPAEFSISDPTSGNAIVAGWGSLKTFLPSLFLPTQLMKATIPIVPVQQCKAKHYPFFRISPGIICAGDWLRSACDGDSGGPLVLSDGKVAGIASAGVKILEIGCSKLGFPMVYQSTAYFKDWIQSNS